MKSFLYSLLAVVGMIVMGLAGGVCIAAIPELGPDALVRAATHIFRGQVVRVYSSVEKMSDQWETTFYVAEVRLTGQDKGESLGPLAYVRFQGRRYIGPGMGPPGDYGIQNPPKPGAKVQVFARLAQDGGLDILRPNGLQVLP